MADCTPECAPHLFQFCSPECEAEAKTATWAVVPMRNGGSRVDVTRLTDGRVMCQECFIYFRRKDLWVDLDGEVWDVCKSCAETTVVRDAEHGP